MRIVLVLLCPVLAACAAVEQREAVPASDFRPRDTPAATTTSAEATITSDRIELSGDSIPVGTTLRFSLLDAVSSATAKVGDRFRLRSETAVVVNGIEILPSGLSAYGEVIHADNRGLLGKPGELLLKLRALQWQGRDIRLRNSVAGQATDRTSQAVAISVLFGLAGLFVKGNEVELPVATVVVGDLAEAVAVTTSSKH